MKGNSQKSSCYVIGPTCHSGKESNIRDTYTVVFQFVAMLDWLEVRETGQLSIFCGCDSCDDQIISHQGSREYLWYSGQGPLVNVALPYVYCV
jgi:hypothetical protein